MLISVRMCVCVSVPFCVLQQTDLPLHNMKQQLRDSLIPLCSENGVRDTLDGNVSTVVRLLLRL